MKAFFDYLIEKPYRLTNVGKCIAHLGWFFSLAGLFGWFGTTVIETFTHKGPQKLVELYPELPLWWVPESVLANGLSIAALVFGGYVVIVGRRVDRLHHSA